MVECPGKSVNFGVRQARGNADRPIPGCLTWPAHVTLCFTVSFLHRGTIHECPVPFLAQEGCLIMWSSYYWAELEKDSFATAFLSLLLSWTVAPGGRPCRPLHVNSAHRLNPGFSPSFPGKLPLRILLQSPLSPLQAPGTLLSVIFMLVIPGPTEAMTSSVLTLFFFLDFLFQFSEVYVLLPWLDCKSLEGGERPYNLLHHNL